MSSARSPLLLGTRSAGKLRELRPMFERAGFAVVDATTAGIPESAEEDALEVAQTFEENALLKARYFRRLSGMDAVADDSGIEVRALGGAPGVVSKRWSNRPDLSGRRWTTRTTRCCCDDWRVFRIAARVMCAPLPTAVKPARSWCVVRWRE